VDDWRWAVQLDLEELERIAGALGFRSQVTSDALVVDVSPDARLTFRNLPDDDVGVGFAGTGWHTHLPAVFLVDDGRFVEHDEATLLEALACGELLIVELRSSGAVTDRWLHDRRSADGRQGL
jgi:hypothetical protein